MYDLKTRLSKELESRNKKYEEDLKQVREERDSQITRV